MWYKHPPQIDRFKLHQGSVGLRRDCSESALRRTCQGIEPVLRTPFYQVLFSRMSKNHWAKWERESIVRYFKKSWGKQLCCLNLTDILGSIWPPGTVEFPWLVQCRNHRVFDKYTTNHRTLHIVWGPSLQQKILHGSPDIYNKWRGSHENSTLTGSFSPFREGKTMGFAHPLPSRWMKFVMALKFFFLWKYKHRLDTLLLE